MHDKSSLVLRARRGIVVGATKKIKDCFINSQIAASGVFIF
jgi:hypothetical protein